MQVYEIQTTGDLKEIMKHGSNSFPLGVYKTLLSRNKLGYVQLHWHDEVQFALVLKGCVNFTVEQSVYTIEENNGIFINSNRLHSIKSSDQSQKDCEYICIDISPDFFLGHPDSIIRQKYLEPFLKSVSAISLNTSIDWESNVLNSLSSLYQMHEQKDFGFELEMQCVILNLLHLMIVNKKWFSMEASSNAFSEDQRIKQMLSYIQQNYKQKIALEDIAQNANLSRAECCRFFKRMTKLTPFEYLISYRINQSMTLLRESDLSITEIAYEVGFGSVSYFIEKFRKQTNCTPKEFRNFIVEFIEP